MTKKKSKQTDLKEIKKYIKDNYSGDYEVTKMTTIKVDLDDNTDKVMDKLIKVATKELDKTPQEANDWIFTTILRNYLFDNIVKKAGLKSVKYVDDKE